MRRLFASDPKGVMRQINPHAALGARVAADRLEIAHQWTQMAPWSASFIN